MNLRTLIVDDEVPARRRLRRILKRIEGVEVIGEAVDGLDAAAQIEDDPPDLLLLDVDMPERDGLQLAAMAPTIHVIFVTAHSEHAVKAFELAAVDYLLKPISEPRLREAIERVRARTRSDASAGSSANASSSPSASSSRNSSAEQAQLGELLRSILPPEPPVPRLSVTEGDIVHIFDARRIERLSAANRYVSFVLDRREYLLDESLNTLQERLAAYDFVRVHRAELINLKHVRSLRRLGSAAEVELASGARVKVSRRLLPDLEQRLGARR